MYTSLKTLSICFGYTFGMFVLCITSGNYRDAKSNCKESIFHFVYALPLNHKDIHFDIPAAKAIIQRVLKPKYEELHKSEGFLYVGLIFESSGKLSDISFGVMRDTPISLKDLAEIDDRLRKTLSATYTGNEFKDHKIFVYSLGSTFF